MGRELMKKANRKRRAGPKCGAKTKHGGHPCQNAAMANGRCRLHGGATPKGDGWHKPVWPKADAANWNARLSRKLADLNRAKRKRARLVGKMTPEQRAQYAAWLQSHKPGSAGDREADRLSRRNMVLLTPAPERPASDEVRAIAARIAEIEAENAALAARLAELKAEQLHSTEDMGIFG